MIYQDPYKCLIEQDAAATPVGFVRIEADQAARRKLVVILKNPEVMYLLTEKQCVERLTTCFRRLTIAERDEIYSIASRIKVANRRN